MSVARRLEPRFVERVWGTTRLAPYFPNASVKIGEVWFTPDPNYPLLVKFIFTSERLSVQVHPDDAYAARHEGSRGKTEMWHILSAEPDASIALGFKESVTKPGLRKSIEDGTVEDLLAWVPVGPGQSYFTPAGVVHAIGGGIILCEIQQNSDVTYRLWDYGRGRELHLEKGMEVSETIGYQGRREYPVECEHFRTELIEGEDCVEMPAFSSDHLLIAIAGQATLNGESFRAGEVFHIPANAEVPVVMAVPGLQMLRVSCPR